MSDYKLVCGERLPGGTHDHSCYYTKARTGYMPAIVGCGVTKRDN
jgi:hypothetical protein